jgi:2-oxoglutarate dehydrogenase E2 component (dihydrolipoamide succinyltransferase)
MPVELTVPEAGESITEVQIGEWRKSVGDAVEKDEVLVDLESDKATLELPAPVSGRLTKVLKEKGDTASVGDVIAHIEEGKAAAGDGAAKKPRAAKGADAREETPAEEEAAAKPAKSASKPATKKKGEGARAPAEGAKEDADEAEERDEGGGENGAEKRAPAVAPAARRALREHGMDAADVEGSGPGGRILKEDVERAARAREKEPDEEDAEREAGAGKQRAPRTAEPRDDAEGAAEEVVPMSPIRRRIAERLVEAQRTAALLTTFNEIDMSVVIALRKEYGETFREKHGVKLGFLSFFVKAAVEALKRFPAVNAEVRDESIVYKNRYDVGIAIGGGKGLVVPVVRNAERLSFAEIEKTIGDFATRAEQNRISLDELKGGTFTISNGGVYGSLLSTPIVNPPQSGILGLHAIQKRPVERNDEIVLRPMMYVALTYDHRVVDGREAVTFLRTIKEAVENPSRILLEI